MCGATLASARRTIPDSIAHLSVMAGRHPASLGPLPTPGLCVAGLGVKELNHVARSGTPEPGG